MNIKQYIHATTRKRAFVSYAFLTPALLLAFLLFGYPLYLVVKISLHKIGIVNLDRLESAPLTLENYAQLVTGSNLGETIIRSVVYMAGVTIPAFVLGLLTALLFNKRFPGNRSLRTLALLPWAVPKVVAGAAFLWMMDGSYGIINYFLTEVGLLDEYVSWLSNPSTALVGVMIPMIWTEFPFYTLIILAALQNVPSTLYEASKIDGATSFQTFYTVTWPGIRSSAVLATLLGSLTAFREFDLIYSLTQGGPIGKTETLAVRIYNEFFVYFNGGLSASMAVLTMALLSIGVLALYPFIRKEFF